MSLVFSNMPCNESGLQEACAAYLESLESEGKLTFNHPPHEGKRTPWNGAKLKKHGMRAGEPDLVIYHKGGKVQFIELKTLKNGYITTKQKARHAVLRRLGYTVDVVFADTPRQAVDQVKEVLEC